LGGAAVIFILGIIFWGGFNTAMEVTNTLEFCIGCHEMENTVYKEYKNTIHYSNRTGVRASCSDCHVPKDWFHKTVRKVQASGEIYHKLLGTVNTPEKFDAKRLELAKRVWTTMKSTDSRECRNCHSFDGMNPEKQKGRAAKQHENAQRDNMTCIDCHKGIAHKPVHQQYEEEEEKKKAEADAKKKAAASAATPAAASAAVPAAASKPAAPVAAGAPVEIKSIDWAKVPEKEIVLFYPGTSSIEWVLTGTDHGGARSFKKADRCFECHGKEAVDIGKKIVSGEKNEKTPIPGKPGSVPVKIKAVHDGANLYMQFAWPASAHAPVPFAQGGKMDAENEIKLAMMIDNNKVEMGERSGCWTTCHHDAKTMPDAPAGQDVTKYIPESRTAIELRNSPRGGWDKAKPQAEQDALLAGGTFIDLFRYKSGKGESEDGYILDKRVLAPSTNVAFKGEKQGDKWVVTMVRRLVSGQPGDVAIEAGKTYSVGFAIHDDFTSGRFHHVSLDYKLGLDNAEAEINATKQ
jgi:nitrate/TMAO reductase-like tetraheme cytochrome c subunit